MAYSTLWGVILITCAGIAFAIGMYATNIVFKTTISRLLMIICSALVIWFLGLAITVAADSANISMSGHFLAPIGWGMLYGLLLHFTLLFSGKNELLKKWWLYPLLYLPGLVMIYAFTILPAMGTNVDELIHTIYGWVPVREHDIWDYLYYAYFISFTVTNVIVLLTARTTVRTKDQSNNLTLLAICYIIAFSLGTLSHLVTEFWDIFIIPRYSAVFSLIPLLAIAYIVQKDETMRTDAFKQNDSFGLDLVHHSVYRITALAFVLGSIINIVSQKLVYTETNIPLIGEFSVFLFVIAIFILIVDKLKIEGIIKEMFLASVYSLVIPYFTLRYVSLGGTTIWAFVFLLIIICLIYNRKILLITITLSAVLTQLLVWTISPVVLIEVNLADYMVRLGLIGIAIFLALYVNSIYVAKLKENYLYSDKEIILSEISRDFISAAEWNKEEIVYSLLEKCGQFLGVERAYISFFEPNTENVQYSYEWLAEGIQSQMKPFEKISSDMLGRLGTQFEFLPMMKLNDAKLLPPIVGDFKSLLCQQNIRGLVSLPIRERDEIIGFMGFNSSKPLMEWNIDSDEFLEIISNIVSDMLAKIKSEERNERLAFYDQLTQLPNRLLFKERLNQSIKLAQRTDKMVAVIFMDIDSFKMINDTLGHVLGDKALVELGQVLSRSIRNNDTVARFGGDEFVILLNQLSNENDAIKIMDKIMSNLKKPLVMYGQELFVTVSAGMALYPQNGEDSDTLIKNADNAMYMAKDLGKNRYLVCSPEMEDQVAEKVMLANNLHRALERNQLMVYYQPQINIETKKIVGFEALLRWSLPDKGMISPATFIPIAEQNGLINPIGAWVLETACRQNKLWQDQGHTGLRMAVNISVLQLNNPRFTQQVEDILKRTGLSAEYLELEITESAVSNNAVSMLDILTSLKALGVSISIDDFGIEYSSLSRLKYLPIDRMKIDIHFIRGIEGDEKDREITKVIINLAKSMKLKVIAEGVETENQLDFLSQWLCDEVQGFYYYKPMPAEEIDQILGSVE